MKKFVVIILAVVLAVPVFQACKKGANDPGISLSSRAGRLVGEWQVFLGETIITDAGDVTTEKYDDGQYQYTTGNPAVTSTGSYIFEININKDGSYEQKQTFTFTGSSITMTQEGYWYFLGANKDNDVKNKECVAFQITSTSYSDGTTTITDGFEGTDPLVYFIDRLSSKEIVFKYSYKNTSDAYTQESEFTLIPQ